MRWCRSAQSGEFTTEVGEVSGERLIREFCKPGSRVVQDRRWREVEWLIWIDLGPGGNW